MNTHFNIQAGTAHVWLAVLTDFIPHEERLFALLSPDEIERAMRFHFPLHKQRFVITRGLLRKIVSTYAHAAPEKIVFTYGDQGKPFLRDNPLHLQFNVSHSADLAVFAFTTHQEIGVDIEKMEGCFKENIAKRFFSPQEYVQLMALSGEAQVKGFYQIWAMKEAVIKASGQGLLTSLSDFSVSLLQPEQSVGFMHAGERRTYYVKRISVPEGYQAAFAASASMEERIFHYVMKAGDV